MNMTLASTKCWRIISWPWRLDALHLGSQDLKTLQKWRQCCQSHENTVFHIFWAPELVSILKQEDKISFQIQNFYCFPKGGLLHFLKGLMYGTPATCSTEERSASRRQRWREKLPMSGSARIRAWRRQSPTLPAKKRARRFLRGPCLQRRPRR